MRSKFKFAGILISAAVLLLFSFYSFNTSETTIQNNSQVYHPAPTNGNQFLIGVIQTHDYLDRFDELGLNLCHKYIGTADKGQFPRDPNKHTPVGYLCSDDYLYSDVPTTVIRDSLASFSINHAGSKLLWMRPKIEWLAYGQSSNANSMFYLTKIL